MRGAREGKMAICPQGQPCPSMGVYSAAATVALADAKFRVTDFHAQSLGASRTGASPDPCLCKSGRQ